MWMLIPVGFFRSGNGDDNGITLVLCACLVVCMLLLWANSQRLTLNMDDRQRLCVLPFALGRAHQMVGRFGIARCR